MDKAIKEIISKLPNKIGEKLSYIQYENLQEIRMRVNRPIMLYYSDRKVYLGNTGECTFKEAIIPTYKDIENIVTCFCENSVYAYTDNIKEGFITLPGGHRVGLGGRAVVNRAQISNLCDFSSVNIRIAREYIGISDVCIKKIADGGKILNTIIIAPPNAGKTTLLRDISRKLSYGYKVVIIDERQEIASVRCGVPQFDIGLETDVLSGFSKNDGITHALRSLSPDVIVCDEIGTEEDILSVKSILKGGSKIITTMHGYSVEEAYLKHKQLISLFDVVVLMDRKNGRPEVCKCLRQQE